MNQRQGRAHALSAARRADGDRPPGEGPRRRLDPAGAHDGRTGAARAARGRLTGTRNHRVIRSAFNEAAAGAHLPGKPDLLFTHVPQA